MKAKTKHLLSAEALVRTFRQFPRQIHQTHSPFCFRISVVSRTGKALWQRETGQDTHHVRIHLPLDRECPGRHALEMPFVRPQTSEQRRRDNNFNTQINGEQLAYWLSQTFPTASGRWSRPRPDMWRSEFLAHALLSSRSGHSPLQARGPKKVRLRD